MLGIEVVKDNKEVYGELNDGVISVLLSIDSSLANPKMEIMFSGSKESGENLDLLKEALKLGDKVIIRVKKREN